MPSERSVKWRRKSDKMTDGKEMHVQNLKSNVEGGRNTAREDKKRKVVRVRLKQISLLEGKNNTKHKTKTELVRRQSSSHNEQVCKKNPQLALRQI